MLSVYCVDLHTQSYLKCADQEKKMRSKVHFLFRGEGLGLSEAYFGEFYYVNLINLNFPDLWIRAHAFTSKLHLKYATVLKVHVVIIELKMFNLHVFA